MRRKTDEYKAVFKALGRRYRAQRKKLKIRHSDFEDYGIHPRLYQYLEAGKVHNLVTLFRISKILKTHPSVFLKGLRIS